MEIVPGQIGYNILQDEYRRLRPQIERAIGSFEGKLYQSEDAELFDELIYVLLAAGSSASSALRGANAIKGIYAETPIPPCEQIARKLHSNHCRFHTVRAGYIHSALTFFRARGLKSSLLKELAGGKEYLRDYLVRNIRGMGYKAGSHFLRNVGLFGLAILDRHIVHALIELGLIDSNSRPPTSRADYLRLESLFQATARELNFTVEELDLLLWGIKAGKVLK